MKKIFSAPTVVNLEITDACNLKCRHCYNFWREEGSATSSLTKEKMDEILGIFADAKVFHVVFSGGEPMVRFELLEHAIKRAGKLGMSVSCNTNLILATDDKMKRLADAGLDHVLTSLNSHDRRTNDDMVRLEGAFDKIVSGIKSARRNNIRVSANMIVQSKNKDHVYDTGKLCHEIGVQKIFGTRIVPSVNLPDANDTEFELLREDAQHTLDQLVRVKEDTGIMIGTLVSYPLCILRDLERYADFVGRGCPAQSGHVMSVNANGQTHACVHEEQGYGNIFEIGIREAYRNMIGWHDTSYYYPGCKGCDYIQICETGCRLSARAYFGSLAGKDQLMEGRDKITRHYKLVYDPLFYQKAGSGARFKVPGRLRFRKEDGFYLVNIRWANTIVVPEEIAVFLMRHRESGAKFTLADLGKEHIETLARLYFKDAIESDDIRYSDLRTKMGLSVDPLALPGVSLGA